MFKSQISDGSVVSFDGKVSSLCTYVAKNGRSVWVGECEFGYLYGFVDSDVLFGCPYLSACFRFSSGCQNVEDLKKKASLVVDRDASIPASLNPFIATRCLVLENAAKKRGSSKVADVRLS